MVLALSSRSNIESGGIVGLMACHSRKVATFVSGLALLATPAPGEARLCAIKNVTVSFQIEEHAELVCDAVQQARVLFQNCSIPSLIDPIRVDVVEDLLDDCLGLYHCGENLIEVLSPSAIQDLGEPDGVFAHLSIGSYFKSIVVHELAHAATDGMPCPIDTCHVGPEYIAYSMQVMSLSRAEQMMFEQSTDMDRLVSVEELNPLILFMAPDVFTRKVWTHLAQRETSCEFIGQLVNGEVVLDQEPF